MRGTHKHESASCKLAYSQAIPSNMRGGILELLSLQVPKEDRGKGYARALLTNICLLADKNRVTLITMPEPFGELGLTLSELVKFYEKAGFFFLLDRPKLLMARQVLG